VAGFNWIGFQAGRYWRWGRPHIELVVEFADEELDVTQEVARLWGETIDEKDFVLPNKEKEVVLTLDGDKVTAPSASQLFQFRGRSNNLRLLKTNPQVRQYFAKLPGVFWFDQFRNLGASEQMNGDGNGRLSYEVGVAALRRYLAGWRLAQQSLHSYTIDYLDELEKLYSRIFPNRKFAGVEPMPGRDTDLTDEDFYFLLHDGKRTYDISEMSAGEQAVFPILYEFVRQQIGYSVVLIDEIDLNLHPPVAQMFVRQLPRIGTNCQFILTTHSEAVTDVMGQDNIFRLPRSVL